MSLGGIIFIILLACAIGDTVKKNKNRGEKNDND